MAAAAGVVPPVVVAPLPATELLRVAYTSIVWVPLPTLSAHHWNESAFLGFSNRLIISFKPRIAVSSCTPRAQNATGPVPSAGRLGKPNDGFGIGFGSKVVGSGFPSRYGCSVT